MHRPPMVPYITMILWTQLSRLTTFAFIQTFSGHANSYQVNLDLDHFERISTNCSTAASPIINNLSFAPSATPIKSSRRYHFGYNFSSALITYAIIIDAAEVTAVASQPRGSCNEPSLPPGLVGVHRSADLCTVAAKDLSTFAPASPASSKYRCLILFSTIFGKL